MEALLRPKSSKKKEKKKKKKKQTLLVLDLLFDGLDGVGRLHLKGDSLPRQGLDENLHDF